MNDYLLLIHEERDAEAHAAFVKKLRETKIWRDSARLRPSNEAKRVEKGRVLDGPFAESEVGAYYLFAARNLDAALAIAKDCGTTGEVRPVMGSHLEDLHKDGPGEVYALAVLGKAKNEQAWTELMDRIDEKTSGEGKMPPGFIGGFRLEAPSTGKRLSRKGVIDGPFQESKEIVGGVCFVRGANMDEVVKWAQRTAFLEDGTLEIRRLA